MERPGSRRIFKLGRIPRPPISLLRHRRCSETSSDCRPPRRTRRESEEFFQGGELPMAGFRHCSRRLSDTDARREQYGDLCLECALAMIAIEDLIANIGPLLI